MDFILQAQHTWATACARGRWYEHCRTFTEGPEFCHHSLEGGFGHFDSRECFEADYQQALLLPAIGARHLPFAHREVHPSTRIPTSLITGPWSEEQLRRLFWLKRGGAMVDEDMYDQVPWEVRDECLRNMVAADPQTSIMAFNCLMDRALLRNLPAHVVYRHMEELDGWRISEQQDETVPTIVVQQVKEALKASELLTSQPSAESALAQVPHPICLSRRGEGRALSLLQQHGLNRVASTGSWVADSYDPGTRRVYGA
jgi:hypothetical protein